MIRDFQPSDRKAVLALNEANVPEVGPMDDAKLDLLITEAVSILVVDLADEIVGFMVVLGPSGTYESPNYRWFVERYDDFVYVDRIAIAADARGQGWGPALYERFEQVASDRDVTVMAAEVNTVPVNERSLHFHRVAGFVEVARCRPYEGDEEVAMLVKTRS